jgi:hypothetical protein
MTDERIDSGAALIIASINTCTSGGGNGPMDGRTDNAGKCMCRWQVIGGLRETFSPGRAVGTHLRKDRWKQNYQKRGKTIKITLWY